jgi:chromosome partitioning protein
MLASHRKIIKFDDHRSIRRMAVKPRKACVLKTLAILSRKGGTGKTTLALHLAVAAYAGGRSTLLVDLDRQRSAVVWKRQRAFSGPRVIDCKPGALFTMQQAASRIETDLVVIDTSPSGDDDADQAARAANLCLIVLRPNFLDLKAVEASAEMVHRLKRPACFVINQAPPRRGGHESAAIAETVEVLERYNLPIAPIGLRSRIAYQRALETGQVAQELEPDSPASVEIKSLWRWVEEALWPQEVRLIRRAPTPADSR